MGTDEGLLDAATGLVLLIGAGAGFVAMAVGVGLLMAGYPAEAPATARPPQVVFAGALGLQPIDLVEMGILILMATPVARVALLVLGFLWYRRFRFALVSLLVLALLFVSFIFAAGG